MSDTGENGLPAGIYVRISSDQEDTGLGVKRQEQDCRELAAKKGWQVVEIYRDNDVSATSGAPRPAYERMIADIRSGRIQGVVVWAVDRLTRTVRELEDVIDFADKYGLELANCGGEIDLSSPSGRAFARMSGVMARLEVEQSARRIRRKNQELAEAGRYSGPRPFGWDYNPRRGQKKPHSEELEPDLLINEAEAAVIRECVDRVLKDGNIWKLTRKLAAEGVTTPRGMPWQTQTLRRMLMRWMNCGVRYYKGIEYTGNWEPILDRETYDRLVAKLTDPARISNNRGTALKYLLTSLLHCGECDSKLAGVAEHTYDVKAESKKHGEITRRRVYRAHYKCHRIGCMKVTRRMDHLDAYISKIVVGLMEREGVRILGGDVEAAEAARVRIEEIEAKLALAADRFADDEITSDQLQRITAKLRPQLAQAQENLRRAVPASQGLADFAGATAAQAWEEADLEQRRAVIKALLAIGMKITVDRQGPGGDGKFRSELIRIDPPRESEAVEQGFS